MKPLTDIRFSITDTHQAADRLAPLVAKEDPDYPVKDPGTVTDEELNNVIIDALENGKDYRHSWGDIHNFFLPKKLGRARVLEAFAAMTPVKSIMAGLALNDHDTEASYEAAARSKSSLAGDYSSRWLGKLAVTEGLREDSTYSEIKAASSPKIAV